MEIDNRFYLRNRENQNCQQESEKGITEKEAMKIFYRYLELGGREAEKDIARLRRNKQILNKNYN